MPKLLMLKGLPASGKSTYARELVDKGWWRVNKDELRAMVHNGAHSKHKEKFIIHWRDELIKDALGGENNVVVDDTNFNPVHRAHFQAICEVMKYQFEEKFFDVSVEECINRDLKRLNSVGEKVIRDMYNQYLRPKPVIYTPPENRPMAILCDIDGTLAHGINATRKPYEWDKVDTDTLDETISSILSRYWQDDLMVADQEPKIILMSGRDGSCRGLTQDWLHRHGIRYHSLFMRETGDKRKDFIIKRELFDKHIRNNYQILFVLDDRRQVVEMWRNELGLKVLQVAEGEF